MPIPAAAMVIAGEAAAGAAGGGAATAGGSAAAAGAAGGGAGVSGLMGQLGGLKQSLGGLSSQLGSTKNSVTSLIGKFHPLNIAVKLARGAFDKLTDTFHKLAPIVVQAVEAFHPLTVLQFRRAMLDLQAVFGQTFKPVLVEVTALIRRVADYFYSLPPAFKAIITSLARTTAIAGTVAALGTLFATLGSAMLVVKAIFGPVIYLFEQFKKTIGGAGALRTIIGTVESVIGGIVNAVQRAWSATSGLRASLSQGLDRLGASLSELFQTLKPLLALDLAILGRILTGAIAVAINAIDNVVRGFTMLTKAVTAFLSPLSRLLATLGFKLPDMSRPSKDSFGLGWSGASVTDPASLYNRLTEEIARNSRPAEPEPTTPEERSANAIDSFADLLKQALLKYLNNANVAAAAINPATALRELLGF